MYLEKSTKWSPYGIALSMALIERCFEEVYKKPWKYGLVVKLLRIPMVWTWSPKLIE